MSTTQRETAPNFSTTAVQKVTEEFEIMTVKDDVAVVIKEVATKIDPAIEATEAPIDDVTNPVELSCSKHNEENVDNVIEKKDGTNKKKKYYKKNYYKKKNKDKRINSVASITSTDTVIRTNMENQLNDKETDKKPSETNHEAVKNLENTANLSTSVNLTANKNKKKYINKRNPYYGLNGRVIDGIIYPDNVPIMIQRNLSGPTPRYMQKKKGFIPVSPNFIPIAYDNPLALRPNPSFRNSMNYNVPLNNVGCYKPKSKYYKPHGEVSPINPNDYYYGPNPFPKINYRKKNTQNSETVTEEIKEVTNVSKKNEKDNENEKENAVETTPINENNLSSTSVNTIVA